MMPNRIGGVWRQPAVKTLSTCSPATDEVIGEVWPSGCAGVERLKATGAAFGGPSRTPVMERVRLMFCYKQLPEEHVEELAAIVTSHHGKALEEARAR